MRPISSYNLSPPNERPQEQRIQTSHDHRPYPVEHGSEAFSAQSASGHPPHASPGTAIPQSGPVTRAPRPDGLPGTCWIDRLGRPLTDLRISVTDHCNFRCRYCMPKEKYAQNHNFLAMTELLTFDEILRVSRIAVANGIEKIRLTGGEPLLRNGH